MNHVEQLQSALRNGSWTHTKNLCTIVKTREFYHYRYDNIPPLKSNAYELTYNFHLNDVPTGYGVATIFPDEAELDKYYPFQWIGGPIRGTRYGTLCLYVMLHHMQTVATAHQITLQTMSDRNPQPDRMFQREKLKLSKREIYNFQEQFDAISAYLDKNGLLIYVKKSANQIIESADVKSLDNIFARHFSMLIAESFLNTANASTK